MEIELKLALQPHDAARLRRSEVLRQSAGKALRQKLLSIYFDTPQLDLLQAGMALRVRKAGKQWIQTAKGGGAVVAGLHQRAEWECQVKGAQPEVQQLPAEVLNILPAEKWQQLTPVFTTEFWRTTWDLVSDAGVIEMALDQGEVRSGDSSAPIHEVELELKQGDASVLLDTARALLAVVPLKLDSVSKAERGYRLFSGSVPAPMRSDWPALQPTTTVTEGFALLVSACLQQLQKNSQYLGRYCDSEYVHQMRVAIRRFYAVLHLLRKEMKRKARKRLRNDLRWLMQLMSPVRDLDVLLEETLPQAVGDVPDSALEHLRNSAEGLRSEAQQALLEALAGPRFQLFLLNVAGMLLTPPILARYRQNRLEPVLHRPLDGWQDKLVRRLANLPDLSVEQRHRLRIRAKRLRYASEFVAALYPQAKWKTYRSELAQIQDALGTAQDRVVAMQLSQLIGERDPALWADVQTFQDWLSRTAKKAGVTRKQARSLGKLKPFWQ